ncbi:hypothetical protein H4R33_007001 [Dimargaris cristalligena]|nr:hypothetical protein H4R33_007001 [Dimargaris cristalligena]
MLNIKLTTALIALVITVGSLTGSQASLPHNVQQSSSGPVPLQRRSPVQILRRSWRGAIKINNPTGFVFDLLKKANDECNKTPIAGKVVTTSPSLPAVVDKKAEECAKIQKENRMKLQGAMVDIKDAAKHTETLWNQYGKSPTNTVSAYLAKLKEDGIELSWEKKDGAQYQRPMKIALGTPWLCIPDCNGGVAEQNLSELITVRGGVCFWHSPWTAIIIGICNIYPFY